MVDIKAFPFSLNDKSAKWVEDTLNGMTLEEKIGQLFCLITYTSDEGYLNFLTRGLNIGGVMLRTMPTEECVETVERLQNSTKIPLLISANLEAGVNQTSTTGTKVGCEMAIAATDDVKYAEALGDIIGKEAGSLGVNWAFSPIIDIDYNWRNPITNTRTFGSDPKRVKEFGEMFVKTVQGHGMATSIKHFPGDGVDERDQHLLASVNTMDCDEWMDTFGKAYKGCIDQGALTAMVGHIMLPSWSKKLNPSLKDEDILPGLVSEELLNGLLRGELGFNGMIVTDSSTMAGMGTCLSREKAVPLTIAAGCDMFLFTKNLEEDMGFMRQGVENGTITPERLDDAVRRILATKAALDLPGKQERNELVPTLEAAKSVVGCDEHKVISKEVADKSITMVKEEKGVLPISKEKYPRVLLYGKETKGTKMSLNVTSGVVDSVKQRLEDEGFQVTRFVPADGFEGLATPVKDVIDNYDLIVYVANLSTKSNQTVVRLEWDEPMGADCPVFMNDVATIFISTENPYHLADAPRVKTYINTYGSTPEILSSLVDKLMGRSEFVGKSPVDAFCGMWDTHL